MAERTMLEAAKVALQITATEYDEEIQDLIDAALLDLKSRGILVDSLVEAEDKLLLQAVKTYVRAHFGSPSDYERLCASYEMQLCHMMHASGYTDWGEEAGD